MAQVTVTSTFKPSEKKRRLLENLKARMSRAIQKSEREIIKRTQSGKEINGAAFKPYSPEYKKQKNSRGKKRRQDALGRGDVVNLTLTGNMLQAITHTVDVEGNAVIGKIYFNGEFEAKKARWNMVKRPFFGLSKSQMKYILTQLKGQ